MVNNGRYFCIFIGVFIKISIYHWNRNPNVIYLKSGIT
ncbi:hypothetical protein NU09_1060 [Flavobacterium beibuense]|uniref:Uncharacterized protein n=1 Tax=Flavobacterium beibuense TaxID=657326 RepID=A0A444WF21_9FLAO|nr:hypothetical protein NU09_1060 [Flavobacterium beibuense]